MFFIRSGNFSWQSFASIGILSFWLCSAPTTQADWVAGVTTDTETDGIGGVVEYHWQEFAAAG